LGLAFTLNGFEVVYQRYSRPDGRIVERPAGETLIWIVGRKLSAMGEFKIPQQDYWWGNFFGTKPAPQAQSGKAVSAQPDQSVSAEARATR
ncbi:MAG TPA: hypothetical protein VNT29_10635, partial [Candidatus Limnocylindrales bacterium]|nr:hypothetical protein [Candidatus Limnocylindrales bacterium]